MLRQGLWRTPAVRYTNRPHTDLLDTDRVPGAAAASQGARSVRLCSHPDTGRRVRLRQVGGGPAAAVAAPGQDRACRICSSALVMWSGRRSQRRMAVRMRGHRTRPAERREPARPGTVDTRDAAGHGDTAAAATLDSRQQDRPPPGNGVRPERDPNVRHRPPRPADRQIRSLVLCVDLVGSRRIWPAHVECLVDLVGSRRISSDRLDDQTDDQVPSAENRRQGEQQGRATRFGI
jgi:hypothetical protein